MKVALAQVQFSLGDFDQNCKQVLNLLTKTKGHADIIVFPEGGLWSYPPKDFLYHDTYFKIQNQKFQLINNCLTNELKLLLPAFIKTKDEIQNGVFLFEKNKKPIFFQKEFLPNQGVFFESRYFTKGTTEKNIFFWKNKKVQILICEDLWQVNPSETADLLITVNASPYTDQKQKKRLKKMKDLAKKYNCPAVYLNRVGAQDSLIFDGGSFALNRQGAMIWQGEFFKPDFKILNLSQPKQQKQNRPLAKLFLNIQEQRERALILGIKSFFVQTGFSQAILGLSGGMDSALVAYLALQALGKGNVKAYFLPGPYTQPISYKIVQQLAQQLKIQVTEKNITPLFETFKKCLFNKKNPQPLTLQNIQSRLRMLTLMAEANETSNLLLATGNKSEIATGYSTLYGDLAGALAPIGDLLKTQVYELARFINKKKEIFPKALLLREPSAELAPKQKDRDDLLPYNKLDPLLTTIFENQILQSPQEKKLARLVQRQEFKRVQAPLILKVSERDLGESWKRPIAHNFPI